MKKTFFVLPMLIVVCGCTEKETSHNFSSVIVETVFEDSVSIRAIEFLDSNTLAFAGSKGLYGTVEVGSGKVRTNQMRYDTIIPEFRAVAHTGSDFFMVSVASPALLYKTGDNGQMDLVYKEEGDGVFYDSMSFWNDFEGIAIGDTVGACFSIIITRDGGHTWNKLPCDTLPTAIAGEGAYAASNTNIKIVGDKIWVATTKRILFSADKGKTWQAIETPIQDGEGAQGIYSIDFYDENLGFAIGGDYTNPNRDVANKAITKNGGKIWSLTADGMGPGYKSCVQFVPNSGGEDVVALGFTGISYSTDGGLSWKELSEEGFYTLRFLNDSTAYAAGNNRISRLVFNVSLGEWEKIPRL